MASDRDLLNAIIEDLKNEHARFKARIARMGAAPKEEIVMPNEVAKAQMQKVYLEAKMEYLELLIHRYTSWQIG